ncbi:ABC transporter permease [Desulfotomaculum sp. 1211_IL3151]|uniref:ABC transporter permease n=1 Tax=Desulfotomaculum sp. 1211_IL3151 TaxID=3084055 RepID=UPI002FDAAC91
MSLLGRKLWRTIWQTKGQFLAVVAVVMVAISFYIAMTTAYFNLNSSKETFYREKSFADYYFQVINAPQQITKQIELLPGVNKVTGRIQKDVPILLVDGQRATARLVSYPTPLDNPVNSLQLLTGRFFEQYPQNGGVEVLVDPQYALGNALAPNDTINIVAEGKTVSLTVVGTATGPEFVYPMKDASSLLPDPKAFGIVMLPLNQAQQVLNLNGQINQIIITTSPGTDEKELKEQVESILKPYGNLASYSREDQLSHAVLQAELDGIKVSALLMPTIFLAMAASIQFIILGRMIKSQRLQIGVMKALGYSSYQIILYYSSYAIIVGLAGALLGTFFGLILASGISIQFAKYFNLPEAIGGTNIKAIAYGFILSLTTGALAGIIASRRVIKIQPAEAMRPEPPKGGAKIFLEHWDWLWRRLGPTWKMSIRTIFRNPERFSITLVGIVFAIGILVVAMFTKDSIDYMLTKHYGEEQRYDYIIRFVNPLKEGELLNISRLEGVRKVEPFLEVPVKMHDQGRSEEELLLGLPIKLSLKKLVGDGGQPLSLHQEGILISQRTAAKLGLGVGDQVLLETLLGKGSSYQARIKIVGINRQFIGNGSYISLSQLNKIINEHQVVSGAMLKVDSNYSDNIEERLSAMKGISFISSLQKELDGFNKNMESMIYSVSLLVAFAIVLGFAIIYNSAMVSFAERKREFASLRVLGFRTQDVSGLVFKEILLQSLLGIVLGLPFGRLMAQGYVKAINTDLYSLPVVVYPSTYLYSIMGGIFFILAAYLFVVRGVKRLDIVESLKNRE